MENGGENMNGEYISFEEGYGKNGKISLPDLIKRERTEGGPIDIENIEW